MYMLLFLLALPEFQSVLMRIILLVKITVHFRNGLKHCQYLQAFIYYLWHPI